MQSILLPMLHPHFCLLTTTNFFRVHRWVFQTNLLLLICNKFISFSILYFSFPLQSITFGYTFLFFSNFFLLFCKKEEKKRQKEKKSFTKVFPYLHFLHHLFQYRYHKNHHPHLFVDYGGNMVCASSPPNHSNAQILLYDVLVTLVN